MSHTRNTEYVIIDCLVHMVTDKAVQIAYRDDEGRVKMQWIPLSQCDAPDTIAVDDEEIHVARWLAIEKDLPH